MAFSAPHWAVLKRPAFRSSWAFSTTGPLSLLQEDVGVPGAALPVAVRGPHRGLEALDALLQAWMARIEEGLLDLLLIELLLHFLECLERLRGVIAGADHEVETLAIGFPLLVTGVTGDGRGGAERADQVGDAPQDRNPTKGHVHRREESRLVLGAPEVPDAVPVRDVHHLVPEHGRQLSLVVQAREETRVDVQRPVRHGERVEPGILHDRDPKGDDLQHRGRLKLAGNAGPIRVQLGVPVERATRVELLLLLLHSRPHPLLVLFQAHVRVPDRRKRARCAGDEDEAEKTRDEGALHFSTRGKFTRVTSTKLEAPWGSRRS